MRLEALPPYSPQLNPVEHIWDEIREKWFANEVFDSLDGVEDRLVEALVALENDKALVASTTGFDWIINCVSTAALYENAGARVGNEFYIRGLMRRSGSAQEPTVCCPQGTDHVRIRAQRLQLPIDL